ncbi:DeoR/GlpR family DNA-binding transcription regulator [Actinomadura macrotermitis]|uniref:HTH-type transcriptional repressor GlcR n=1 Tax=Actinomadura macrotermitis TaxID=2585200 RepID=A0A7K0C2L5_9ACTN|nr:DeoR/GlpR family DNA-binding transcription regulator [Actinomadura macrotermitis]MQY07671.1 HTH-type transcriptional repressor GlcR [Actinomadura macrotermitis]
MPPRPGFAAERRRRLLELVRANGAVALRDLAASLQASEATVRRDLRALEAEGLLDRPRGGAMAPGGLSREPTHRQKAAVAAAEKAAIARAAVELVDEGDAIVVGAGTTTRELARALAGFGTLTVVTNSLLVAGELAEARGVEVVVTGGSLRGSIHALVGGAAEQSLAALRVRRAFLSGNGLTAERGLSTPNMMVAGVDRALAHAAEEVVALVDHTKVGVDTMFQTVPVERIAHLVTDARTPAAGLAAFADAGVGVRVAPVS